MCETILKKFDSQDGEVKKIRETEAGFIITQSIPHEFILNRVFLTNDEMYEASMVAMSRFNKEVR